MVREHGVLSASPLDPAWRLVIAPAKGTISRSEIAEGASVAAGSQIGQVSTLRDSYPVTAPHGGTVVEWLVEEGDPVSPGQPLLRLHPQER
ncbi:MAG: HlyD family efflux transporter periplasmic adaptor subunit [Micrococcales bacterium]|nr:HlyD family efflux transporter periplasmic adaptor subunit [Micrococcales bacterium]